MGDDRPTNRPRDVLPDRVATPRLMLRRWHHDEAARLNAVVAANLEHLRPWMPWVRHEPMTVAERVALIEQWTREWEDGGDAYLGVFLDGEVVGSSGFHRRVGPDAVEIGYWIDAGHTRRGYATEVTSALTTAAFGVDGIERVEVHVDEANGPSTGIPVKLGYTHARVDEREPEAPGECGRLVIWTMTRDDWTARP